MEPKITDIREDKSVNMSTVVTEVISQEEMKRFKLFLYDANHSEPAPASLWSRLDPRNW